MFQTKEQNKTLEKQMTKMEISNRPYKEFKVMVIKMLNKFGSRMDELSENSNKETENI